MKNRWMSASTVCAFLAAAFVAGTATAGPDWIEGGEDGNSFLPDAGPLPGTAQPIDTPGRVHSISGRLRGAIEGPEGDFQDMYLIQIEDFNDFFITNQTLLLEGTTGDFLFDISLFLFTGPDHPMGEGIGILANLDCSDCFNGEATLFGSPTDDSVTPELINGLSYYIAMAGAGSVPVDAFGNEIFSFASAFEVSGPDGEGGFNPIAGWIGEGLIGEYFIPTISGANGVPTPGAIGVFGLAGLAALRRRR